MIKAVLFDYCGVLTEGGKTGSIRKNIAELTGRPIPEIQVGDLHDQLVRNQISDHAYFAGINKEYPTDHPVTRDSFIGHSDIYVPSKPVYKLAEKLRAKGIKTAIVSNMYNFAADKLRAAGAYNGFSPVVLSHEEGVAKPDRQIFERALHKLGLPANEVLYVDDQERFRPVVEGLGMPFIVAVSPKQIVADIEAVLAKENNLHWDGL